MSSTVEATETWVGRSVPRKEDAPLVTGAGQYVPDMALPGTLEVAFLRSPHSHARIRGIDVSPARSAAGVVAVFTWDDIKERVSHLVLDQESASPALEAAVHPQIRPATIEILAEAVVRYVGQPVAAVVAASRYQAEDAAELIEVDYEELPAVTDPERAQEPGVPQVFEQIPNNLQARYRVHVGDPEGVFASAPQTLRMHVRTQRIAAASMETRGVLAQCIGEQITLWSSTQIPHIVRNAVAARIGVPEWQVRVIAPHVGGGFGSKVQVYAEEVLLAHIARVVRQPVRWVEDRQENLVSTAHARDQVHEVEAAFDSEGRILAVRDRFLLDSGICCPYPLSSAYNVSSHFRSMYAIRNFEITGECVLTHKMFNLPYRGAGRPEAAFVMDRVINEVARRLDLDPADVIRRNLIQDSEQPWHGGMPYRDGSDVLYDAVGFPAAFDKALELVDYAGHRRRGPVLADGVRRGIGFGTYVEGTGVGPFESAQVQIDSQGNVVVYSGCSPHGQGLETTMSQVVADMFGVGPEKVLFRAGDTALVPYGVGTFASRSVITAGAAIHVAARRLQERLKRVAAEVLEIQPEDLEVAGGEVRARGVPTRSVSLRDLYRASAPGPRARLPEGMDPGSAESYYFVPPTVTWGFGVVAAAVDVDVETGVVSVRRLAIVHDCGRVIHPVIVEGQVEGGLMQGVGATLYEDIVYDASGQPRATSFMDYLLPTTAEVPEIVQEHMETPSDRNPLGVKGIGEAGTIAPPAAIANAVIDALRPLEIELNTLPLSPAAVLAAIDAAQQG